MKFTIITHAKHKIFKQYFFAYEPYVKEMNLWMKHVDKLRIVAPISNTNVDALDSSYKIEEGHFISVERSRNIKTESHSLNVVDEKQNQVQHDVKKEIELVEISAIDIISIKNSIRALFKIPIICYRIYKAMYWADHIHLRCPGNIGLLGCFVQILFPKKKKTVKYAGNWDPNSKQPVTYRLQKWIVSNTFLTKNCKVLVYGEWPQQSENIIPFFTASYSEKEIEDVDIDKKVKSLRQAQTDSRECHPEPVEGFHDLKNDDEMLKQDQHDVAERHVVLDMESYNLNKNDQIATSLTSRNDESECHAEPVEGAQLAKLKFIYVGGLTPGKQPLLSIEVIHELKQKGYQVHLDMYGDGVEREKIMNYIKDNLLEENIKLHGNTSKEIVKKAFQQSHFLVFISKSEGWPKVVAEAMFWGCVPITSNVSCISYMLGNGSRGMIVNSDKNEIGNAIEGYLCDPLKYKEHAENAIAWSQQYTLERFEKEIGKLLG